MKKTLRYTLSLFFPLFLSSCTYSITQVHTSGYASDVVDETQSNEPDVSPTVSVPAEAVI